MLREFAKYYKPHRKLFVLDMGTAIALAVFGIIVPAISYRIFEKYLPGKNLEMIYICLGGWSLLIIAQALCDYVNIKWGHILGVRMEADMRREMFAFAKAFFQLF